MTWEPVHKLRGSTVKDPLTDLGRLTGLTALNNLARKLFGLILVQDSGNEGFSHLGSILRRIDGIHQDIERLSSNIDNGFFSIPNDLARAPINAINGLFDSYISALKDINGSKLGRTKTESLRDDHRRLSELAVQVASTPNGISSHLSLLHECMIAGDSSLLKQAVDNRIAAGADLITLYASVKALLVDHFVIQAKGIALMTYVCHDTYATYEQGPDHIKEAYANIAVQQAAFELLIGRWNHDLAAALLNAACDKQDNNNPKSTIDVAIWCNDTALRVFPHNGGVIDTTQPGGNAFEIWTLRSVYDLDIINTSLRYAFYISHTATDTYLQSGRVDSTLISLSETDGWHSSFILMPIPSERGNKLRIRIAWEQSLMDAQGWYLCSGNAIKNGNMHLKLKSELGTSELSIFTIRDCVNWGVGESLWDGGGGSNTPDRLEPGQAMVSRNGKSRLEYSGNEAVMRCIDIATGMVRWTKSHVDIKAKPGFLEIDNQGRCAAYLDESKNAAVGFGGAECGPMWWGIGIFGPGHHVFLTDEGELQIRDGSIEGEDAVVWMYPS